MDDVSRLCQQFLLGRAEFSHLIAIQSAIETWESLKQSCQNEKLIEVAEKRLSSYSNEWASVESLLQQMNDLSDLYDKISQVVIINCDSTELSLEEEINRVEEVDVHSKDQMPAAAQRDKKWTINPRYTFFSCTCLCFTLVVSFSKKLSKVHAALGDLISQKEELERNLQTKYGKP